MMRSKSSRSVLAFALLGGLVLGPATQAVAQQQPSQQQPSQQQSNQQEPDSQTSQTNNPGESGQRATGEQPTGKEQAEARGDIDTRYKELTRRAAKAYGDQDYKLALELFEKAYGLKPVPNLRYNMGRIEEKRGNFEEAIGHYEKFVTLAGVDIKARKDALDRLKTLREVVDLRNQGEDVDESKIDEQHEDRELASANRVEEPEPATRVERDYTAAWITMGVALAAYGTSGYFALQARQANDDFESATTRATRREAADSGQTSSIVADSMLGLGVVMTGVSVYMFLSPSETEVPVDQTAMRLAPQIGRDGAGMSFSVEF